MTEPRREILADGVEVWLGDCREVYPNLSGVRSVVSDPPYGMDFRSNHRLQRHEKIANDSDDALLQWACQLEPPHSKYLFCRWDNIAALPKPKSLVTWVKNNWSMGDLEHEHARQTEVVLFYPGPDHFFPVGRPTDVIEAPRSGNEHHPTEKSIGLMWAIVRWTDGVVCDPFCGSGSTGLACIQLGRPFIGIEADPKHFDTARWRLEAELRKPRLFNDEPAKPAEQLSMLEKSA